MATPSPDPSEQPQKINPQDIPDYESSGVLLYLSARITINAPADRTFRALTNPQAYSKWNTFVPSADFASRAPATTDADADSITLSQINPGDRLLLHVRMKPTEQRLRDTPVRVIHVREPAGGPYAIRWDGEGYAGFMLWAHRWLEVVPLDGGSRCEFRSWENLGGLLARVVKGLYGETLQARFFDWATDLKGFVEAGGGKVDAA